MSAPGEAGCQVGQECLRSAQLGGLEWSHRRSDDRDLQRLCWM